MTLGRNALFGAAVTAALGVPFALSDKDETPAANKPASESELLAGAANLSAASHSAGSAPHGHSASLPSAIEGSVVTDLGEILRFDLTPDWVTRRWPRVMNSRHAGSHLQAYRVPLVGSSKTGGLTGALTYYFTEERQLEGIQFYGAAAEVAPLTSLLASQHGLQQYKSGDPSLTLYEARRDGHAVSQLLIRNAPLIDASQPEARFRVEFVLDHPSEHRMFSGASGLRFDSSRWP